MSNIDTVNVGGLNYSIEDTTARQQATSAISVSAYVENGNVASRPYPVIGTPINWKGDLYYTTATIAQGSSFSASSGGNLASAANIGQMLTNINVYVDQEGQLHFRNATGADSVLPFKKGADEYVLLSAGVGARHSARFDFDVSDYSYVVVMQYWAQGVPSRFGGSITVWIDGVNMGQAAYSADFGIHYSTGSIYDVRDASQFSFTTFGNETDGEIAGAGANGIYAFP